jgi:MoxR-like ATPase
MAKAKKKGSMSRLDLLRRKLQLEQELLEKGKGDNKELDEIDKELDASEPEDNAADEAEPEDSTDEPSKEVETVADLMRHSQERSAAIDRSTQSLQRKKLAGRVKDYQKLIGDVRKEAAKLVVGQAEAVSGFIRALLADGHVLVEGVPGIAKTTLIRTLAQITGCSFSRIQFTPDLLPTDIIGISTYQEGRGFYTLKGPIFNNFVLADEINRAPPKVQSALLEAMAEKQATIAKESFPIPLPFFTMATQNPLENVGTYALPEAQMDRFLFKLYMGYPTIEEEAHILRSNITSKQFEKYSIQTILNPDLILQMQSDVKEIYVDTKVEKYIVTLIDATRFPKKYGVPLGKYVEFGASPRGSIGLFNAARADALLKGQTYVTPQNVKQVTYDVLRHRIILGYEGQAEGVKTEEVITEILKKVAVP